MFDFSFFSMYQLDEVFEFSVPQNQTGKKKENFIQTQVDFLKHKCPGDVVPLHERAGSIMTIIGLILLTHIFLKDLKVRMMSFYQSLIYV